MPKDITHIVDTTGYQKRSDDLLKKYSNLEFVKRINPQNGGIPKYYFGGGNYGTHKMAYSSSDGGKLYAYPQIFNPGNNKLIYDPKNAAKYAFENKEVIDLGTDNDFADYFTSVGYKKPMGENIFQSAMQDYLKNKIIKR